MKFKFFKELKNKQDNISISNVIKDFCSIKFSVRLSSLNKLKMQNNIKNNKNLDCIISLYYVDKIYIAHPKMNFLASVKRNFDFDESSITISFTNLIQDSTYKIEITLSYLNKILVSHSFIEFTEIKLIDISEKSPLQIFTPSENFCRIGESYYRENEEIIAARKSKSWKDYVRAGFKFGDEFREDRRTTRLLRSMKAIELSENIEEEFQLGKNNWCMGPFYRHSDYDQKNI